MSTENSGFIKGFLLGGAMGVIAGLLFAPKSGHDFREDLKDESDDIIDKAKSELDKVRDELSDLKERITKNMEKRKQPGQTAEERAFEEGIASSMDDEDEAKETPKNSKSKAK